MIIFVSLLTTFNLTYYFWAAQSLPGIGSRLKLNSHSQVKLVQIPDAHSRL